MAHRGKMDLTAKYETFFSNKTGKDLFASLMAEEISNQAGSVNVKLGPGAGDEYKLEENGQGVTFVLKKDGTIDLKGAGSGKATCSIHIVHQA